MVSLYCKYPTISIQYISEVTSLCVNLRRAEKTIDSNRPKSVCARGSGQQQYSEQEKTELINDHFADHVSCLSRSFYSGTADQQLILGRYLPTY